MQEPVDSENVPSDELVILYQNLQKLVEGLIQIEGYNFTTYTDQLKNNINEHGFRYLNSIYCSNCIEEIKQSFQGGLKVLNDECLIEIYHQWVEINDSRETVMLQKIYHYSKEHNYERAVFTLGAAHKKSIMQKIEQFQATEPIKLNWTFYSEQ